MDKHENEAGWADLPIGQERAEPTRTATMGDGIPADSPSRMRPPEPAEPQREEQPEETPEQREQRDLEKARLIARETAEQFRQQQLQTERQFEHQQQRQQFVDPYAQYKQQLAQKGIDSGGLDQLDELLEKREQSKALQIQEQMQQQAMLSYHRELDNSFIETIDELDPGSLRASLIEKTKLVFQTDPEFAEAYHKARNGQKPSTKLIKKVAEKANNLLGNELGLAKPLPPVSLQSSKPAPARGTSTTSGVQNLDREQRNYYDAFVKELGHKRALESAKRLFPR